MTFHLLIFSTSAIDHVRIIIMGIIKEKGKLTN